ncbi:hypothetical protein D5086_016427 [Populus alba]|uniref:Uncharacterized protein n=1 Tax=Populus alba TaxID=43335 RepID=A0ACC4BTZ5_POPAL
MLPAKAFTRMGLIRASPQAIMLPMYKTTVPVTSEQMIRFDPVVFFKPAWFNLHQDLELDSVTEMLDFYSDVLKKRETDDNFDPSHSNV